MSKKKSKSNATAPEVDTQELGDYVNEEGEVLMTEAEARAKIEAELREKIATEQADTVKENTVGEMTNEGNDDFIEFTVSGCYYDSRKETIDFEGLKIRVPANDEEICEMNVRRRYTLAAIKEAKNKDGEPKYPKRVEKIRQIFIDDSRPCKGAYTFVGKNIKEISNDELQDLATRKDLRFIPLPNSGLSRRDALIRAYVAFADKMFNKEIKWQEEKFNFAKLPDIILDGRVRTEGEGKITNEEMIAQEQNAPTTDYGVRDNPRNRFTIEELKAIADNKNIQYPDDVDFTNLYNKLFSA